MLTVLSRLCAYFTICHVANTLLQHACTVNIHTDIFFHLTHSSPTYAFTHPSFTVCSQVICCSRVQISVQFSIPCFHNLNYLICDFTKVISKTHSFREGTSTERISEHQINCFCNCDFLPTK